MANIIKSIMRYFAIIILLLLTTATANAQDASPVLGVHNVDTGLDYSTIQAAIDDPLTVVGNTILVDSGVYSDYNIYGTVVSVNKSLTLIGRDSGSGMPVLDGGDDGNNPLVITADGVTIDGFVLNHGWRNGDITINSNHNVVRNCKVLEGQLGIIVNGDYNVLHNNTISDNWYGMCIAGSNNLVTNNTVENNPGYGLQIAGRGYEPYINNSFYYNNLSGNYEKDNPAEVGNLLLSFGADYSQLQPDSISLDTTNLADGKPIYFIHDMNDVVFDGSSNVSIIYCINCTNVSISDLALSNNRDSITLCRVRDASVVNVTISRDYGGIYVASSSKIRIEGCNVSDNIYPGLYVWKSEDVAVLNNTLDGMEEDYCDRTTIENNIIGVPEYNANSNFLVCLVLSYSTNCYVFNNTISSCNYDAMPCNGLEVDGIGEGRITNVSIVNNNISDNRGLALYLGVADHCAVIGNLISNNLGDGISLEYSDNNRLEDNTVCLNDRGAYFNGQSDHNTVVNNTFSGQTEESVVVESGDHNSFYLNNFIRSDLSYANFRDDGIGNAWNSTVPFIYSYNGSAYTSCLGNYWSDYDQYYKDANGDGVPDDPDPDGDGIGLWGYDSIDAYPLVQPTGSYTVTPCAMIYYMDIPGVTIDGGHISIMENAGINTAVSDNNISINYRGLNFLITTDGMTENSGIIEAMITGVHISTIPTILSIPVLGTVSYALDAELSTLPPGGMITSSISPWATDDVKNAYELAARDAGLEIGNISYVLKVKTDNIDDGIIGSTIVHMSASPAWVLAAGGADNIGIVKLDDSGAAELLETTYDGIDPSTGNMLFEAQSNGFCTYGLVVVHALRVNGVHNVDTGFSYSTIQAAIDDPLTLAGNTILVDSGVYNEQVNVKKSLILRGNDTGSGRPLVYCPVSSDAITLNARGCVLDGIDAKNSTASLCSAISIDSSDCIVTNCTATDSWCGIMVHNVNGITVNNTTVKACNADHNIWYGIYSRRSPYSYIESCLAVGNREGITIAYSNYSRVSGCTALDNIDYGISDVFSSFNVVENCRASNTTSVAISMGSSINCTIVNCTASKNPGYGIYISNTYNYMVSDCNASDNNASGISLYQARYVKVTNCTTNNNWGDAHGKVGIMVGQECVNASVTGCTANNNGQHGIYITACDGTSISDCVVNNNMYGIYSRWVNYSSITGCEVNNSSECGIYITGDWFNDIRDCRATNGGIGILCSGVNNTFSDCDLSGTTGSGIQLLGNYNNTITRIHGMSGAQYGIYMSGSSNNLISDLAIDDSRKDGIHIESGSLNNTIRDVTVNNSTYQGIIFLINANGTLTNITSNYNGRDGIWADRLEGLNVVDSRFIGNREDGIYFISSKNSTVKNCNISYDKQNGAHLYGSSNITFTSNQLVGSGYNVYIDLGATNNGFYLNNITNITGTYNGRCWTPNNSWNSPEPVNYSYNGKVFTSLAGNFWSDYVGYDDNDDGIGDSWYSSNGIVDQYPMLTRSVHSPYYPVKNLDTGLVYTSIQAAIDDPVTVAGNTILVDSGIYTEQVNVKKRLTLRGNDTGSGRPLVYCPGIGNAILLSARGCVLDGIDATNSTKPQTGAILVYTSDCIVKNCTATNSWVGIYVTNFDGQTVNNTTVVNCNVSYNSQYGMYSGYSTYTSVIDSIAIGNVEGMTWAYSSYPKVIGCTFVNNSGVGSNIALYSDYGITDNCTAYGNGCGIGTWGNKNGSITNCIATNNSCGFSISSASNASIRDCNARDNIGNGISIYMCPGIIVDNCTSNNNWGDAHGKIGIALDICSNATVSRCTADNNGFAGINVGASDGVTIKDCTVRNDPYGIYLHYANYTRVTDCTAIGSTEYGICNPFCWFNLVDNCTVTNGRDGIANWGGTNNTYTNLLVTGNSGTGIGFSGNNDTLADIRDVSNNYRGVYVGGSDNLIENFVIRNSTERGIHMEGDSYNNTFRNITVKNSGRQGILIAIRANGSLINVSSIDNGAEGLWYDRSSGISIDGCNFTGNAGDGIYVLSTANASIRDSNVSNNRASGVHIFVSSGVSVNNSFIGNNTKYGVWVQNSQSCPNAITWNDIRQNGVNVYLSELSSGSIIYGNDLANASTQNAFCDNPNNRWNSSTPFEYEYSGRTFSNLTGNFWSDYAGYDDNGDGIGDTPYVSGNVADQYPLVTVSVHSPRYPVKNLNTGKAYQTIQAAIDDPLTLAGHTIEAESGVYLEHITVNKGVTLRGNDTGSGYPVIDAGGSGVPVRISADNVVLEKVVASNDTAMWGDGITVTGDNVTIKDSVATGINQYAILLSGSDHSKVLNCTSTGNGYGIWLSTANYSEIRGNDIKNSVHSGIVVTQSSCNNVVSDNNADGCPMAGIWLSTNSNYNVVANNSVSGCIGGHYGDYNDGILLQWTCNNTVIAKNNASGNAGGIAILGGGDNNTVVGNTVSNNLGLYAITASGARNTTVTDNAVTGNLNGIYLTGSDGGRVSGNTVQGNSEIGIYLWGSRSFAITDNVVRDNKNGMQIGLSNNNLVSGNAVANTTKLAIYNTGEYNVIEDNTVSRSEQGIPIAGNNSIVANNTISYSGIGVLIGPGINNTVGKNTFTNNPYALQLYSRANFNAVTGNTFTGNDNGILLYDCGNNTLSGNSLDSTTGTAIKLYSTYDNTISSNRIAENHIGIEFQSSNPGNKFYNNFMNNSVNVKDGYANTGNNWNTSLTPGTNIVGGAWLGGNYWSDYAGYDDNDDGIGDTPYVSGNVVDHYPLVTVSVHSPKPPKANFTSDVMSGIVPLSVSFTDTSAGTGLSSWAWDFGDGSISSARNASHTYVQPGSYNVTLTVASPYGTDRLVRENCISVMSANVPPVANAGSDIAVFKGATATFDGSASSDQDGTIVGYAWDFGDGSTGQGAVATHAYSSIGTYNVTLTITDNSGAASSDTLVVTVSAQNVPPVAEAGADISIEEGSTASFSGAASIDDDGSIEAYGWDFGDGSSGSGITASHVYADNGVYTVRLTVMDDKGASTNDSLTATVINVAPAVGLVNAPIDPQKVNIAIEANATFTDQGSDTHTAVWDWNDGSTSAGIVDDNARKVSGSHAYAVPGVYTVTLTVTDDDGGVGTSSFQYVVVYDPAGGFVTGGGWINSLAGAYVPNPALAGKASFGFNSKYQKGSDVPSGDTEFQFKVADLNFKSTSYDWLVVNGKKAQFKGLGTINGAGSYRFMLTAIDDTQDKFRIRIWDDSGIVYDNQMNAPDTADPTTVLGGGSIQIHK